MPRAQARIVNAHEHPSLCVLHACGKALLFKRNTFSRHESLESNINTYAVSIKCEQVCEKKAKDIDRFDRNHLEHCGSPPCLRSAIPPNRCVFPFLPLRGTYRSSFSHVSTGLGRFVNSMVDHVSFAFCARAVSLLQACRVLSMHDAVKRKQPVTALVGYRHLNYLLDKSARTPVVLVWEPVRQPVDMRR